VRSLRGNTQRVRNKTQDSRKKKKRERKREKERKKRRRGKSRFPALIVVYSEWRCRLSPPQASL
jgi:hypothetical protein